MTYKTPIIPFFLHYLGCPNRCVYCNQSILNGSRLPLSPGKVRQILLQETRRIENNSFLVAYYGASFTLLPLDIQESYLGVISEFKSVVKGLYISTRPDGITREICEHLKKYKLQRVEMGVQTLDRKVLKTCRRGYEPKKVRKSLKILSDLNIERGVHLMLGLPGQTEDSILLDLETLISWGITHLRVHPVLVLKNTLLAEMYKRGSYVPWTLERCADICATILKACKEKGIKVLRLGLQPSATLEKKGNVLAGPYHPSFGEICYSYYYRQEIEQYINQHDHSRIRVCYPLHLRSQVIGPNKINTSYFQEHYPARQLFFESSTVQEIQIDGGITI